MGVWRPFTPVGFLSDAAAAVNAATPTEAEALIKELDKIDPRLLAPRVRRSQKSR
ncbi:hypothetical protein [Corynebacterium diphtheriae]|uniref:hypothetical protein n=1 Tax=Corynebacterium diphtheriae TaxID=1717 RepID=UPI001A7E089D|nr:hypothetical protein [Corynebacterium diphtheriae]